MKKFIYILFALLALAAVVSCGKDDADGDVAGLGHKTKHEYVDLGLPSGTLWATCNVGASSPEEYGDYFAWGEVEPKNYYGWITLKYCLDNGYRFSKYVESSSSGTVDKKTEFDPEDDAAYMNWGEGWRMPSRAQQDELRNNCTWTWNSTKKGYTVVGPNGASLFLPAAGLRDEGSLSGAGSWGYYWSRSLGASYSGSAYGLYFNSSNVGWYDGYRYYGFSVRPVRVSSQN